VLTKVELFVSCPILRGAKLLDTRFKIRKIESRDFVPFANILNSKKGQKFVKSEAVQMKRIEYEGLV